MLNILWLGGGSRCPHVSFLTITAFTPTAGTTFSYYLVSGYFWCRQGPLAGLGSFLLLSEEEQQERAQGIYDCLPEALRNKLTVADVRNILVANAEMSDVWGEPAPGRRGRS